VLFCISNAMARSICAGDIDSIDCLNRLLDSRKSGLLLMYSTDRTAKLVSDYLDGMGNKRLADLFKTVSRRFREKKGMLKELSRFVFLTTKVTGRPKFKGKVIYTSPKNVISSNLLYPPILLGENLTDCELYVNAIAQHYTELPRSLREIRLSQRFEPGGGNNTHTSYSRHKNLGIDLCLCIVDSDRGFPAESAGDTAKFVQNVDKNGQSPYCSHLLIDAYSAENLLPLDEISRQYRIGKSEKQVAAFEIVDKVRKLPSWRYLPLKKGIKGKDLKTNSARSTYWNSELAQVGINQLCCAVLNCSCDIIPNVNEKTLARALEPANSSWQHTLNNEKNSEIRENYRIISQEVRSWLCVGAALRL